jgi:hypothetical protein
VLAAVGQEADALGRCFALARAATALGADAAMAAQTADAAMAALGRLLEASRAVAAARAERGVGGEGNEERWSITVLWPDPAAAAVVAAGPLHGHRREVVVRLRPSATLLELTALANAAFSPAATAVSANPATSNGPAADVDTAPPPLPPPGRCWKDWVVGLSRLRGDVWAELGDLSLSVRASVLPGSTLLAILAPDTTPPPRLPDFDTPPPCRGSRGPAGFQGFQGFHVPQGSQGPAGSQGFQTFHGPQGFLGPQGFQGSQGSHGPAAAASTEAAGLAVPPWDVTTAGGVAALVAAVRLLEADNQRLRTENARWLEASERAEATAGELEKQNEKIDQEGTVCRAALAKVGQTKLHRF